MSQYLDPQQVVDDLGDKFLVAFIKSIEVARVDLSEFEGFKPEWFVNFSKRFVANFIHERVWDSMVSQVHDHPGVTVVDREPTRQIHFGTNYVVRFKRHTGKLKIESFPTKGALAFWANRATPTLPGLEVWTLAMGYIWQPELGEIGDAILSFRDGKDKPIWSVTLNSHGGESATDITWEPIDPQLPQLDLSDVATEDDEDAADGS
ncbi:hypothetical protein TM48_03963 [Mycobacterium shottsii]|nr:hypothetical protein TM48_03963 [Mycobacterium shottsii]